MKDVGGQKQLQRPILEESFCGSQPSRPRTNTIGADRVVTLPANKEEHLSMGFDNEDDDGSGNGQTSWRATVELDTKRL